uniref:Uncharacterized protein n=1 Tax=Rhizophora mucronata TaxID=61149 RepID=A0A2P2MHX5_RHIMU
MVAISYPPLFVRSTTMTLTLSALCRPRAMRVSSAAANVLLDGRSAPAPPSSARGPASVATLGGGFTSPRQPEAISQAMSPDKTSHKPSLARIRHSSSGCLFVKEISGSDITIGFKYLSPEVKYKRSNSPHIPCKCQSS